MRLRRNHTDHLFIYASVRKKLVQGTIVLTLKKKKCQFAWEKRTTFEKSIKANKMWSRIG